MKHELKVCPAGFKALSSGKRKSDYRINDRGFRFGDQLIFSEFDMTTELFTGKRVVKFINRVQPIPGILPPYVILHLSDFRPRPI